LEPNKQKAPDVASGAFQAKSVCINSKKCDWQSQRSTQTSNVELIVVRFAVPAQLRSVSFWAK